MVKTLIRVWDVRPKKKSFKSSSSAETEYYKQLRKVAKAASKVVSRHRIKGSASLKNAPLMQAELDAYSKKIEPWAKRQAKKMLETVSKSSKRAYKKNSKLMSALLKTNVAEADVGIVAESLVTVQVGLIKSIPEEAGLRAQKIAIENFLQGTRAVPDQSIIDQLMEQMDITEEVAINRAKLIARTETARANSAFVEARANAVGAKSYIWRTTMDGAERDSHRKMNGKIVFWDTPPRLSDGTIGHAGTFPNCRCYAEPVLPE